MIKTLTPHYVTTSFVSGISGLTCTSYTLELFIWNGSKANSGTIPTYSVTKDNPLALTSNDKVDIARLVSDFIEIIPVKGSGTSSLDGANQIWIKSQVKYTTSDLTELDTPQTVQLQLAVKGYGYGMEGENPQPPTNKIHMSGTLFNVYKTSAFNVPILIDEVPSTIDAVNDTANIFYQDTTILILTNDDLGFEPTIIKQVVTAMTPDIGTLAINDNVIEFTAGSNLVTPQTFDYTIQDATGEEDTATVTLNFTALPATVTAVDDFYSTDDVTTVILTVLTNDSLGTEPTTITTVVQTGLTSGVITITGGGTTLTFTPNGIIPSGNETFTYTIEDSLTSTDTATVTMEIKSDANRYLERAFNFGIVTGTVSGTYSATNNPFTFNIAPNSGVDINACVIEADTVVSPNVTAIYDDNINC